MSNTDWSGQPPQSTPPPAPQPQADEPSPWAANAPTPPAPQAAPQPPYAQPPQQSLWVGQPTPPVGYAPYQPPAKKGNPVVLEIAISVGALMLVVVIGFIAVFSGAFRPVGTAPIAPPSSSETTEPAAPIEPGEILPATEYQMVDRPGWQDMVDTVSGIEDKYKAALEDGSIVNMTPVSPKDNPQYFKDFFYILWDYNAAIPFMEMTGGTDPVELDARIAALKDKALLTESQFLAGEEFGISIKITREDGSVYESDGTLNQSPDGSPLAADPEEFARSFQPTTGSDGTYIEAAATLAAQFGRYVSYDFQTIYDHCSKGGDDQYVMAAFCAYDPSTIYVNTEHGLFPEGYADPGFLDTIKHELAHATIYDICGTSSPIIAGGSVEAVTSSYAVLFFGAGFDQLQSSAESFPEYAMTEASDAVATSINEGSCF